MIKINLIQQRKAKRQASSPGERDVAIGVVALLAAGAATFLAVHKPRADELGELDEANQARQQQINARRKKLADLADKRAAVAAAKERTAAINRLIAARAVPAHMLHELGQILTPEVKPTMTQDVAAKVGDAKNDAWAFRDDWNPRNVWVTSLEEKKGVFTLSGGAESDADVAQLSKRMQASAYFDDVVPSGLLKTTDRKSAKTYYTFTITGKVVY